jgi:hypothetical protein
MTISKQHLVIIPGSALGQPSAWKRGITMAAAAAALLSLGVIFGGMVSPQPGRAEVAKAEGPVAQLPVESWYFPAQYVNQGKENEEQPWAYE